MIPNKTMISFYEIIILLSKLYSLVLYARPSIHLPTVLHPTRFAACVGSHSKKEKKEEDKHDLVFEVLISQKVRL